MDEITRADNRTGKGGFGRVVECRGGGGVCEEEVRHGWEAQQEWVWELEWEKERRG